MTNHIVNLDVGEEFRKFARLTKQRVEFVHKNLSIVLFNAIVYQTPVDTGEARGSWHPSVGSPKPGGPRIDKIGSTVTADIQAAVLAASIDDTIFMTNRTPHIYGLEYGTHPYKFSPKAPEGMVRINVTKVRRMVSEAVAQSKEIK